MSEGARGKLACHRHFAEEPIAVAALAVTFASLIVGYWPAFSFWWSRWFVADSYYSHGPFVPLASAFLVWANRRRLAQLIPKPSFWGFPIMIAAGLTGWFAWMGASASVMGFTLPLLLFGCVIAVFGFPAARLLAFPICLLWFAAPPPESLLTALSLKLQLLSIHAATTGLNAIGMSAANRGTYLDLPSLTVEVGAACSGYRLLVSMLAIAAFFAYIRRGPLWGKSALVALALPLSLAMNSVRIIAIALIGERWGLGVLSGAHDVAGYGLLLITVGFLLLLARLVGCTRYREMPLA